MMNFNVVNKGLSVGNVRITGVTTSSIFMVGDAERINCSSVYDTPPESIIIGRNPFPEVPLASESGGI